MKRIPPGDQAVERTYERTWDEIEQMLTRAETKRNQWKKWFEACKSSGDREGMKEAARNHKALDGVIKTLRWTLGEVGVGDPLD
jgi:ABC-type branched-subunit amino acid transport system substrate-binding protein